MDRLLRVKVLTATPEPNRAVYAALHQDYSSDFVGDEELPPEGEAGEIAIRRLLAGERGHYGPLEHAQIVYATGFFPHSVMQQARTHRVGVSFDVQSFRYTSDSVIRAANRELDLEKVFYLRPVGTYHSRESGSFEYTEERRSADLHLAAFAAVRYRNNVDAGMPFEQARGLLPFDYRQHFVVSFTLRALMHFLDLRSKADAQLEIRWLCDHLMTGFQQWSPVFARWYEENRLGKARLAP